MPTTEEDKLVIHRRRLVGLCVLVVLLMIVYAHSIWTDLHGAQEGMGPSQVATAPPQRQTRSLSVAVIIGLLRGAIVGVILGADAGITEGMISFGALGGILYWLNERVTRQTLIPI